MPKTDRWIGVVLLAALVGVGAAAGIRRGFAQTAPRSKAAEESKACSDAAKMKLGPGTTVLRCGQLSNTGLLEVLAAIKFKVASSPKYCTPVSRFIILGGENSGWNTVLEGAREIKNSAGYIGLDYIDDTAESDGYCLEPKDRRSDEASEFALIVWFLSPQKAPEGVDLEIAWNKLVGRYQEFTLNRGPEGFQRETKNRPHINTKRRSK